MLMIITGYFHDFSGETLRPNYAGAWYSKKVMFGGVKSKKKVIFVALSGLILVLLIGGSTWLVFARTARHSPFTKKFISSVSFPLYYPSSLPAGYELKPNSIGGDSKLVYYTLTNVASKSSMTISQYPSNFDAAKKFEGASIPSSIIPVGTMYNFGLGDISKYMIDTKAGTFIYINSPKATPSSDISKVANSLRRLTP